MADTWTREELEQMHPSGSLYRQVDDEVFVLTDEEHEEWIAERVGKLKAPLADA